MLSEKIQSIISQRKRSAARINSVKDNFSLLITTFEHFMHTCKTYLDDDLLKSERELTEKIFAEYDSGRISELQRDLDNICKRLSRETLNIAVVGKARQGKSRLLRTITDLPQDIIPDSKKGFCTGVRSDIINKPGISETRATVRFYSEREFMHGVIGRYFEILNRHDSNIRIPKTLNEFARYILPELSSFKISDTRNEDEIKLCLAELAKYHDSINEYRDFISDTESSREISGDRIKEFVVQNDPQGNKFYKYMAVKKVEIYCEFPNNDVAGLTLIDMPGLGETKLGNEERMQQTLSDQVDLVFMITRPTPGGDDFHLADQDVYSRARSALGYKLDIDRWSFFVINQDKENGDNEELCRIFQDEIRKRDVKVSNSVIIDCSNKDEVREKLIAPALDYLEAHITENDKEYSRNIENMLRAALKNIRRILTETEKVLSQSGSFEEESELFDRLFDKLWDDLTQSLFMCVSERSTLGLKRNQPCQALKEKFDMTLSQEDKKADEALKDGEFYGISPEQIELRTLAAPRNDFIYWEYMGELRRNLNDKMQQDIDDTLKEAVLNPMKEIVCGVLLSETGTIEGREYHGGRLSKHFINVQGKDIIKELISFIGPSKKAIMPDILKSLKKFDEEIISYQTIIQPIIRDALNIFDSKTGDTPDTSSAGKIFEALVQEYKRAVRKLMSDFNDEDNNVYSEPNGVAFDIAKNFAGNIIGGSRYTSRLYDDKGKDSVKLETQWRALYRYIRGDIWPEEFKAGQVRREAMTQIRKPLEETAALLNRSFNFE